MCILQIIGSKNIVNEISGPKKPGTLVKYTINTPDNFATAVHYYCNINIIIVNIVI